MADPKILKSEDEWRRTLSPEQYRVLREKGTERAFTGKYNDHKEEGVYRCGACGEPLFDSVAKYPSGCGWPSFYQAMDDAEVTLEEDHSFAMHRTEVLCSNCGSHLGHVFDDGPAPTGKRFCINSAALDFDAQADGADGASGP